MTPLVVSPPDTSGTAVVHIVEREDGPSETECPDDLLETANKKGKEVTFVSMFVYTTYNTYMYIYLRQSKATLNQARKKWDALGEIHYQSAECSTTELPR